MAVTPVEEALGYCSIGVAPFTDGWFYVFFLRGLGIPSRVDPHFLLPMIFFGCGNYGVPYVRSISGGGCTHLFWVAKVL